MGFLFYPLVDVPPLASGVGEVHATELGEREVKRTYLDAPPHLRAEGAAVNIDADRKPRSAMGRCHAIKQLTRLRGRLDAMQAYVTAELDGQSELRLENAQLVCKGRREGRQQAAVYPSVWLVTNVRGEGYARRTVDADFTQHRGWELGQVRADVGDDIGEGDGRW